MRVCDCVWRVCVCERVHGGTVPREAVPATHAVQKWEQPTEATGAGPERGSRTGDTGSPQPGGGRTQPWPRPCCQVSCVSCHLHRVALTRGVGAPHRDADVP